MVVKNFRLFTVSPSMDKVTSSCSDNNSLGISILLSDTRTGHDLVVFPFMVPTSGPKALLARLTSLVLTLLFLIRFIQIIAFRLAVVGVPKASKSLQACLALSSCLGDKNFKFSSTELRHCTLNVGSSSSLHGFIPYNPFFI